MTHHQKILVVDDERINRKMLSALLENDHEIIIAKSGQQALERVQTDPSIDLILLDIMMPEMDGFEALKRLKQQSSSIHIPVIFITAKDSLKDQEKGLKLGAVDYINKPFHPSIVRLRVENHLRFVRQRKLLEKLAGYDGLTEIANRRNFDEALKREWLHSNRTKTPLSLAMIDIDFFKPFNDNYGHAEGDSALKLTAKSIAATIQRPTDLAARYGGEEFVLLLPNTPLKGAEIIAQQACTAIETLAIPHAFSTAANHITISIGGSTMIATEQSSETLIKAADSFLYKAKKAGRNRVLWEP